MKKALPFIIVLVLVAIGLFFNMSKSGDTSDATAVASSTKTTTVRLPDTDISKIQGGPIISFNFDDGYLSTYQKALPIFNKAGFKTTQYIITGYFRKPGYVTKEQVLDMYRQGHEIGAHTRTHPHLSQISREQALSEIEGSRQDLIDIGITPITFAYPFGDQDSEVVRIVRDAGYAGARITTPLLNDTNSNVFLLKRQRAQADTTFAEIQEAIDLAIASKKWVIIVFHSTDAATVDSVSDEMMQQIVDYVKLKQIPVVTMKEGLQLIDKID